MAKSTENEVQPADTLNAEVTYMHAATEAIIAQLEKVAGQAPADPEKECVSSNGTLGILGARLADLNANLSHIRRLAEDILYRVGSD